MTEPETLRIARFLARCGVASRRKAEEIVTAGRVTVNEVTTTNLATQINPEADEVTVDGERIALGPANITLAVHKPLGVLVTRGDPRGRQTIYDLLPIAYAANKERLVYAGRLDYLTEGLLILSTDGDLVYRLTHPSQHVEKEYQVTTDRGLTEEEFLRLRDGVKLSDGVARPESVGRLRGPRGAPIYTISLVEGRNRVVRRMFEALGVPVRRLMRVRIGGLRLGDMEPGAWREIADPSLDIFGDG